MAAARPKTPVLTKVVASAGPMKPTRVVLAGSRLGSASKVMFGSQAGTDIRRISDGRISVMTPRNAKAGVVDVRVRTDAGWTATTRRTRYTFVRAPVLAGISPDSGRFAGGDEVTITGRDLDAVTRVTFGAVRAKIMSHSRSRLTVIAPTGLPGRVAVKVRSAGGAGAGATYTYVVPKEGSDSTLETVDGTEEATGVEWVTGGNPVSGPIAGLVEPWVVGLRPGVAPPAVGAPYVLPPGGTVYPAGLAGTVEAVAGQRDGRTRVTVAPDDLDQVFEELVQDFSGTIGDPMPAGRRVDGEDSRGVKFALRGPSPFDCHNEDGESASLGLNLSFGLENIDIDHHLDMGNAFRSPTFDFAMTADVVTSATIEAEAAISCELKSTWANANRKVFPTAVPSLTMSFGPSMEITLAAGGTFKYEDRTRVTIATQATFGRTPTFTRVARSVQTSTSGSASFGVEVAAGLSLQVGVLDRVGLEGKLQGGVEGTISIDSGPPLQACFHGELFARLGLSLYFDVWIARWSATLFEVKLKLIRLDKCTGPATSGGTGVGGPEITTFRLDDATVGEYVDQRLRTADNRAGSWSRDSALPPGLTLDAGSGRIRGTPTGPVGDYSFGITFTDGDGNTDFQIVRLYVHPAEGLGGGDVQITLTWSSEADLDLHVNDPFGEDIYWENREAESGGQLDHDANAACDSVDEAPAENVFWPAGEAPDGRYDLTVVTWGACGATDLSWTLRARVNGQVVLTETGFDDSINYYFVLDNGVVTDIGANRRPRIDRAAALASKPGSP